MSLDALAKKGGVDEPDAVQSPKLVLQHDASVGYDVGAGART